MIGKYLIDLKEYQHQTDCQIIRIDNELGLRVTKNEFAAQSREKSKKLKNKLRTVLETYETKITNIETKIGEQMEAFKKKLGEIELNTYWKIKDYEDLLGQRVSETFMKDFVRGEFNKTQREYKEYVEKENLGLLKKIDIVEIDLRRVREAMGDQIGEI